MYSGMRNGMEKYSWPEVLEGGKLSPLPTLTCCVKRVSQRAYMHEYTLATKVHHELNKYTHRSTVVKHYSSKMTP